MTDVGNVIALRNVAVITGGASGIGPAVAAQLSEHGMRVALVDVDAPELREVPVGRRQHAGPTNPRTSIDELGAERDPAQS